VDLGGDLYRDPIICFAIVCIKQRNRRRGGCRWRGEGGGTGPVDRRASTPSSSDRVSGETKVRGWLNIGVVVISGIEKNSGYGDLKPAPLTHYVNTLSEPSKSRFLRYCTLWGKKMLHPSSDFENARILL